MSYSKFRQELERRISERRREKTNSWVNLFIKILILVFVILIIHYFGGIRSRKIIQFYNLQEPKQTENVSR